MLEVDSASEGIRDALQRASTSPVGVSGDWACTLITDVRNAARC
jgi:hypothetical protein